MGWMDDQNKPTAYHVRLLSQQDFDFTPFWEEAVVNWLHRNASRLLKVNPHCCKHFIGDTEQRETIATHIPLTDSDDITEFIRSLAPNDARVFEMLVKRLIPAGKADLAIAKFGPFGAMGLNGRDTFDPKPLITTLSDVAILKVLDGLDWSICNWSAEDLTVFLKRLPVGRLKEFPVERIKPWIQKSRYYGGDETPFHKARNRAAVYLANALPKEDLHDFIVRLKSVTTMMDCFSCGGMTAKSAPGYTLHRKVCDPNNAWPNALVAAATRLV